MASNNYGCEYADLWRIWKESPHYRTQIEHWMDLERNLPILSFKTQLEVLENAPMNIVNDYAHLLHDRAKKALGLEEKKQSNKKQFSHWDVLG